MNPAPIIPIIPVRSNDPWDDVNWVWELKLDGFRGLADTVRGRMLSKKGNRAEAVRGAARCPAPRLRPRRRDRKSTRLNSSHVRISYAVFCLKKKNNWYQHSNRISRCNNTRQ